MVRQPGVGTPICSGAPRAEPAIAIQIKRQPLEQPPDIPQSITAPLEYLEFVVQPFYEATGLMVNKIVRNQVESAVQQLQKGIKARQGAARHPLTPELDAAQPIGL